MIVIETSNLFLKFLSGTSIPFSSDRLPFDPILYCLSARSVNCFRYNRRRTVVDDVVVVDTMTIHHFEN